MFRQKPPNEEVVEKLISFLSYVHWVLNGEGADVDLKEAVKTYKVAKRTPGDIKVLKYIKKSGKRHEWLVDGNYRELALKILKHRLVKSKKQLHVAIPDFAEITGTLKTISEHLAQLSFQNERLLKSHKNGLSEGGSTEADLFRIDDQELFIAGNIAKALHGANTLCDHTYVMVPDNGRADHHYAPLHGFDHSSTAVKTVCQKCGRSPNVNEMGFEEVNDRVILITNDLMKKLRKQK